jgi:hypothetical protein
MSANVAISARKENSGHERKPLKFWRTMWREEMHNTDKDEVSILFIN